MRKKMTLEEVQEFYGNDRIMQTDDGFAVPAMGTELVYILPEEFYISIDGEPMDPKRMLTLPRDYSASLLLQQEHTYFTPVYIKILCGKARMVAGRREFWPADFAAAPNDPSIDSILISAHWDLNDGVVDNDWNLSMQETFGDDLWFSHCSEKSPYGESGTWYWIIKINRKSVPKTLFCVGPLVIFFTQTKNHVVEFAEEQMQKFEQHKAEYREKILEVLLPLDGHDGWKIDQSDVDQTVAWLYNVPRGRQSPQKFVYRHDEVGWTECAEAFNWKPKPEAEAPTEKVD